MNPVMPWPDPLPLPAPAGLLWFLLQLTFFLHLLAMNLLLGGALLALQWRFAEEDEHAGARATALHLFAKAAPVLVAATVTLGVAPLLFVQALHGRLFFTSSILMAVGWLAVVPLVITAYLAFYAISFREGAPRPGTRALATLATLVLLVVAVLYTSNVTRALRPDTFLAVYQLAPRGTTGNLADPTFWPRLLHTVLGALALAALTLATLGRLRRQTDPAFAGWAARHGLTTFAGATAANVVVGLWYVLSQPRPILLALAGGRGHATGVLALGVVLGIACMGAALYALGAKDPGRAAHRLGLLLLPTLVVMVLLRDVLRQLVLVQSGFAPPAWVAPQWGAFAAFAALLVAALGTIAWMVRLLVRGEGLAPSEGAGPAA